MIKEWIEQFRLWLRAWLGVQDISLQDIYDMLMDDKGRLIRVHELQQRIKDLEDAYAEDPRRAEIAKEKAEQPNHIAGFTPRSKRIATWEGQRKAEPKK